MRESRSFESLFADLPPRAPLRQPSLWLQVPLAVLFVVLSVVSVPSILALALLGAWRDGRARRRVQRDVLAATELGPGERAFPVSLYDMRDPVSGVPDYCGALVTGAEPRLALRAYCAPGGRVPEPRGPVLDVPFPLASLEVSPAGSVPRLVFQRARYVAGPGPVLAALVHEGRWSLRRPSRREEAGLAAALSGAARAAGVVASRPGPFGLYRRSGSWEFALAVGLVFVSASATAFTTAGAFFNPLLLARLSGGLVLLAVVLGLGRLRRDRYARVSFADRWLVREQAETELFPWELFSGYEDGSADFVLLRLRANPGPRVTIPTPDEATRTAVLSWLDRKGLPRA